MSWILILIYLNIALVAVVAAQDCSDDRLKKCNFIESFLISGDLSNIKWPDNDGQVLELCGKLSSGGKCIAQLNQDCTKNAHIKQLLGNVLHSLGKYSGKVCGDAAGRAGYLKRVRSCYSLKPVAAGHTEQHKRYVGLIEKIAAQPKAIRSQGICCALLYAFESGRATDKASCPADVLAYLDSIRKEIVSLTPHSKEVTARLTRIRSLFSF